MHRRILHSWEDLDVLGYVGQREYRPTMAHRKSRHSVAGLAGWGCRSAEVHNITVEQRKLGRSAAETDEVG